MSGNVSPADFETASVTKERRWATSGAHRLTAQLTLSVRRVLSVAASSAMSRTANDFKMSGGFLPNFDMAAPAQQIAYAGEPEDQAPWTKADDLALKKCLNDYSVHTDDEKPWPVIATKCNFGHNSGSCKARWAILKMEQAQHKYNGVKAVQFGAKGGPIVGQVGQFKTNIAISS